MIRLHADRLGASPSIAARRAVLGVMLLSLGLTGCAQARSTAADPSPTARAAPLRLVVIGDSIPYNSSDDCRRCTGFVDRYAGALGEATHRSVTTTNLSEHTGLTLPGLIDELPALEPTLSSADAIIVGIAHNSAVLNADSICGATYDTKTNTMSDWSKIDARCGKQWAANYEPQYTLLYSRVAGLRSGKPTILLTINRYNDWIGWKDAKLTAQEERRTTLVLDEWNSMICRSAETHDFTCADVYHAFSGPRAADPAGQLLADDYTHPSDKGNAVIAKVLVDAGFAPLV